jgi:uncharacterized protein YgiM (DUF1202 family)
MVLIKQQIRTRVLVVVLLFAAAACAPTAERSTPTPVVLTTTPIPRTQVPTFAPFVTAAPTALPTEPLIIRDALTGHGDSLYVREKPSTMSAIIRQVNDTEPLKFTGRSDDGRWVQATFEDGGTGWLMARALTLPVNLNSLPVTGNAENVDFVALVSPEATDGVPLYSSPHSESETVATLPALTPLRLDGRREDGIWIHGLTADSKEGWIRRSLVDLNYDIGLLTVMAAPGLDTGTGVVQARVLASAAALRLRQLPSNDGAIMVNLTAGNELQVEGRTGNNGWLLVKTQEGYEGWVNATFVELYVDLVDVPQIDNPQPVKMVIPPTPEGGVSVVASAGGGGARQIFLNGQAAGNQRNVFSKVGDSLTDTANFFRGFGGSYNLRGYGSLLPVIQFFSSGNALGGSPFVSGSISARASWGEVSVLDPGSADPGRCAPGETPVACEVRVVKPAVVLIMIGTNDAGGAIPSDVYAGRLRQIIETCIQGNAVPVLSTLPPRAQFNDYIQSYNQVIASLASSYGVPLTDLYSALVNLPNHGYGEDGIHLSVPPGGAAATVDFTPENLQYGATMRNLTALQILDSVWKSVLY